MKCYLFILLTTAVLCCKSRVDESNATTEMLSSPKAADPQSNPEQQLQMSKVALPGINFGVSLKEYQAANRYMLQGLGSNTYFVKPLFNGQSELFKIELSGISRNVSSNETRLWDDHKNLVKFFETDNGTPEKLSADPKLAKMKSGEIKWTHAWSNLSKRIKIGIAESANGETYEVVGWIYDQSMLSKKKLADSLIMHPEEKVAAKTKKRSKRTRQPKRTSKSDQKSPALK